MLPVRLTCTIWAKSRNLAEAGVGAAAFWRRIAAVCAAGRRCVCLWRFRRGRVSLTCVGRA